MTQGADEYVRLYCYVRPYIWTYKKGARIHEGYRRTISQARKGMDSFARLRCCCSAVLIV